MAKEQYVIPQNFMESGYLFSGTVAKRNAVEGLILGVLGYGLCQLLPLPGGLDAITWYILIIGPLFLVGLAGVQGDPLSVFLYGVFKWRRRRKPSFYSEHSLAYTQEAADSLMDAPTFRDLLADGFDKVKDAVKEENIEYVEGKTFRFAVDPHQEALRNAQEEIDQKKAESVAKEEADIPDITKDLTNVFQFGVTGIDVEALTQTIELKDLGEEEMDRGKKEKN